MDNLGGDGCFDGRDVNVLRKEVTREGEDLEQVYVITTIGGMRIKVIEIVRDLSKGTVFSHEIPFDYQFGQEAYGVEI